MGDDWGHWGALGGGDGSGAVSALVFDKKEKKTNRSDYVTGGYKVQGHRVLVCDPRGAGSTTAHCPGSVGEATLLRYWEADCTPGHVSHWLDTSLDTLHHVLYS